MKQQQTILFLVALTCGVYFVCCLATSGEQDAPVEADLQKPSLGKVMSFDFYVQKYNKHYPNAVEAARRAKLFMSRAFQVFVSSVKYLYKRASKYLKINPHSDWTQSERDDITNDGSPKSSSSKVDKLRSKEALERLLAEDPNFAAAVEKGQRRRRRTKRSVDETRQTAERGLSVEDLIGEVQSEREMPAKYAPPVPSNNPNYVEPELFSQGVDDEAHVMQPIPEEEARAIDAEGAGQKSGLIGSLAQKLKDAYGMLSKDELGPDAAKLVAPSSSADSPAEAEPETEQEDGMYVDYSNKGCMMPVKNQLYCGSCYAFAGIAMLEWHHCNQTGKLVPFSEQYVVDCAPDRLPAMKGCRGGATINVGWFAQRHGLELAMDYPYQAKQQTCPYEKESVENYEMGHTRIDINMLQMEDEEIVKYGQPLTLASLLESDGPMFIEIVTNDDFVDYGGGIDVSRCNPEKQSSHAMTIVGNGVENGVEYWLIRNSYGPGYGVDGHYKLSVEIPLECLVRVGFIKGELYQNDAHKGKSLFDELKEKNLMGGEPVQGYSNRGELGR